MPAILLSLLSGAVVAAKPLTPLPWFTFDDYPMRAFEKKLEGVTKFDLLVAPDGSIANCKVTQSSGHEQLDRTTCFLAGKRVKFVPAKDSDGRPAYGVYRSQAVWVLPERQMIDANPGPDLEVNLNHLPEGATEPPVVKLAYSVDVQGNPSSCSLMQSSQYQPQVLVDLGCKELLQSVPRSPVIGPAGQPVEAVKTGAVMFKTGSGR
jgi:TonB family protein